MFYNKLRLGKVHNILALTQDIHDLVIGVIILLQNVGERGTGLHERSSHLDERTRTRSRLPQVYNFGYNRPLPFPSISLTPDTTLRFDLQTSGMQTQSRWSIVVIGKKYLGRFVEIMTVVERIHEETQGLPLAIYAETEDNISSYNISYHETPSLVRILYGAVELTLTSTEQSDF